MRERLTPAEFFFCHAGYSYRPGEQTPLEGRMECARALAMAERWASESGMSFEWAEDDDPLECYGISGRQWICRAYDCDAELVDSLGSVNFRRDQDPWMGDPYRRVIEAELALGLMGEDGESMPIDPLAIRLGVCEAEVGGVVHES